MINWTLENKNKLKELVEKNLSDREISDILNTTIPSISAQRRRMDMYRFKKLTTEQQKLLIELYPTTPYKKLAAIFNCSIPALVLRINHLKMSKRECKLKPEYFYDIKKLLLNGHLIVDIARRYHVVPSSLVSFCKKYNLNPTDLYTSEMKRRHKLKNNAGLLKLYGSYKNNAKAQKVKFELALEDFEKLTSSNCHYCNKPPNKISKSTSGLSDYKFNGLDKKIPKLGYIIDNCAPCCWECNKLKSNHTKEEFLKIIFTIYENIQRVSTS